MAHLISVIVTTYKREDALGAVLRSLSRQGDRDFEVIVADDGSGPETAGVIAAWKPKMKAPLAHVRHEDRGFRAAEIRNRAILASRGNYCIFLDGDCIVRPDFVATHRALAERGYFVTGNRALMSAAFTESVLQNGAAVETWSLAAWFRERRRGHINRIAPMLKLPLGPLRKLRPSAWRGARSCNFAMWRSDIDCVDGFDAAFNGWGKEDSDILVRLLCAGVRRKDGMYATGVLHLWHTEADRSMLMENERKLAEARHETRIRALEGMSALRDSDQGGNAGSLSAQAIGAR